MKSHEAKYKDFSRQTGLRTQTERLQMRGFNKSVSQKAVAASKRVEKSIENNSKSGIINTKFNTTADPMHEVTGIAEDSNPSEIAEIQTFFKSVGVKLIRNENEKLAYSPGAEFGTPGTVYISQGASYSAWLHEKKHVEDDYRDGWIGFRVFTDPQKCIKREIDAYQIEIDFAKSLNRSDIVKRLEALRDDEIQQYK